LAAACLAGVAFGDINVSGAGTVTGLPCTCTGAGADGPSQARAA
jgi:hypothetical protein